MTRQGAANTAQSDAEKAAARAAEDAEKARAAEDDAARAAQDAALAEQRANAEAAAEADRARSAAEADAIAAQREANEPPVTQFIATADEYRAREVQRTAEAAMRNPLDTVGQAVYVVGGEVVDANGIPVSSKSTKSLLKQAEDDVVRLRQQMRDEETRAIELSAIPRDRFETGETTVASSARGGASTI